MSNDIDCTNMIETWTSSTQTLHLEAYKAAPGTGKIDVESKLQGEINGVDSNATVTYKWFAGNYTTRFTITFASGAELNISYVGPSSFEITNMESGSYLFAENPDLYNFRGIFNGTDDTVRVAFYDSVRWCNISYDIPGDTWRVDAGEDEIVIATVTESSSAGSYTITWQIYLTSGIADAEDIDVYLSGNDTGDSESGWARVEADYFNIYNLGGTVDYEYNGTGASLTGEGMYALYAKVKGDSARANVTWRGFQHVRMKFQWFLDTTWNVDNWVCPEDHSETGYLEFGVDYTYIEDRWTPGWKVRIEIIDGDTGTDGNDAAWVQLNCSWYNRGDYVKSDQVFAWFESYQSTDTAKYISLWVDLWVDAENAASVVGGRVAPEYYGIAESGWLLWTSWKPIQGEQDVSLYKDNFLAQNKNTTLSAKSVSLYRVWASINKTDNACNADAWYTQKYETSWTTQGPNDDITGMSSIIFPQVLYPEMVQTGFLSNLISGMVEGVTKPIVDAIVSTSTGLWFVMADTIDSTFARFSFPNFIATMTDMITSFMSYMSLSITNTTTMVVQIFRLITALVVFWGGWITRMITFLLNVATIVRGIIDGTYSITTGLGNVWEVIQINDWIDVLPTFIFISWVNSVDDRWRKGQPFIGTIWGDIAIVIAITSFMVDNMFRLINFTMDLIFRLMNVISRR